MGDEEDMGIGASLWEGEDQGPESRLPGFQFHHARISPLGQDWPLGDLE